MLPLVLPALVWLALHIGLAGGPWRDRIAARTGEGAFRAAFSAVSILALVWLVRGWRAAETVPLWHAPGWLRWLIVLGMLPAFLLLVAAVLRPNPTALGGGGAMVGGARGIQRVTRHPMLWSFALWALLHMLGNGDSASLVFFGTLALTALLGMPSIDAKIARRAPEGWAALRAGTSILPFGAIAAGRNRLEPREIGWLAPGLALLAWAALLHAHGWLFGVSPLPA